MSYEGYTRQLCARGHYTQTDCYDVPPPCACGAPLAWEEDIDETNGPGEVTPLTRIGTTWRHLRWHEGCLMQFEQIPRYEVNTMHGLETLKRLNAEAAQKERDRTLGQLARQTCLRWDADPAQNANLLEWNFWQAVRQAMEQDDRH